MLHENAQSLGSAFTGGKAATGSTLATLHWHLAPVQFGEKRHKL